MTSAFYQSTLQELQQSSPDTAVSAVTYQVGQDFFDAQKEIAAAEELKGFTSVIVIAQDGKIALARKSYGPPGWALPGGGVELDESFAECAQREIIEEIGVRLEDLELVLIEEETFLSPAGDKTHSLLGVFAGSMKKFALPPLTAEAKEEGLELRLFAPDNLPQDMMLSDREKIELFFSADEDEPDDSAV